MIKQPKRFSSRSHSTTAQMFFAFVLTIIVGYGGAIAGYAAPFAGELDASLHINIDSYPANANETFVQTDGKILVGGNFRTVNALRNRGIARLNADYSLDSTFSANVNGTVLAIDVQSDGKIVIGGDFTAVGGASRNRIARLNSDGSLDATFNPGTGADSTVYDVAVQTNGKIFVGGNFFGVNSARNYGIAQLNSDGSADVSFTSPIPKPNSAPTFPLQIPSIVYSFAVQTDGKIVLGGYIVKSYAGSTPTVSPIVRLNQNGAFDATFNPGTINSNAQKIAIQPDGKIVMGGWSTTINGINRNYIARFNTDGSLDADFNIGTGASAPIFAVSVQADGKILLGGIFSSFNGITRNQAARLNADGSLDTTFVPASNFLRGTIQTIAAVSNGKVLIGGSFGGGLNFGSNYPIRVFNSDGSVDSSFRFETTALGSVRAIATQPDGKILVGGNFTRPNSNTLSQIFRINADNSLDTSFGAGSTITLRANAQVNSIIVQPDGKILFAGSNVGSGGSFFNYIGRVNADGSTDASFAPGNVSISGGVNATALQPDGKIIIVWGTNISPRPPSGGIARLNGDGSIDSTFDGSAFTTSVFKSVAVQTDGKILIGGAFSLGYVSSQTGSVFYNGIIRLNADGSRDTTFIPATVSNFDTGNVTEISALMLQSNGKIFIGGRIFTNGINTPTGAARLNTDGTLDPTFNSGAIAGIADIARVEDVLPLPNGKILIGGLFDSIGGAARINIARLNADGSPDSSFSAATDNTVYKIVTQSNGKVLIGGDFETVNGVARTSLARLLSENSTRNAQFDFDGDGKSDVSVFRPDNGVWYLNQSTAGFTGAAFGFGTDKLVPADYDGDGKTDLAVYRGGTWYVQRSTAGFYGIAFGAADDIPVPADYDGDGKADVAVFRPSNGTWYLQQSSNGFTGIAFGQNGDKPVAADYDGDGKADIAVNRNGNWYIQRSQAGFIGVTFGDANDKLVPADYDGDGKADIAVFRPSNGTWYLLQSQSGFTGIAFGFGTDIPVPGDYDGDGKADVSVFRNGNWYLNRSSQGFTGIGFGAATDKPIPNAFIR